MITERVRDREAVIELEVSGPAGRPHVVEAVIDAGYNGELTVPASLVNALQLPFAGYRRGMLADGSITVLDVHLATIAWHGEERDVLVLKATGAALLGMALLENNRLTIDVFEGGPVLVDQARRQS
ncbi:MAG: clan AA aspartic protease [Pirellulales bacterium]